MLERSEASQQQRTCHPDRAKRRGISKTTANMSCWNEVEHLQQTHNKRFFRAKPSTTRLTTYRNDKYVKTPALSSRQSVATRDLNKTYTEITHTRLTLAPTGVDLRFGMTKQRFVIGEFCSNRSNVALPPLRQ